jgi:hypothetical protein
VVARGRLIGLAVLAALLAVATVVVLSGDGEDQEGTGLNGCPADNSSLPVAGARLAPDGSSVRFAYAGAEPCQFAVDRFKGRLYVELRTDVDLESVDRRPPLPFGCVEGPLETAIPPGTPVEPIGGGKRLLAHDEVESLLSPATPCEQVAQGEPGFIID